MSELLSTLLRSGGGGSADDFANVFPVIIIIIINRQFRSHQINQVAVSINKRLICYGNELTNSARNSSHFFPPFDFLLRSGD